MSETKDNSVKENAPAFPRVIDHKTQRIHDSQIVGFQVKNQSEKPDTNDRYGIFYLGPIGENERVFGAISMDDCSKEGGVGNMGFGCEETAPSKQRFVELLEGMSKNGGNPFSPRVPLDFEVIEFEGNKDLCEWLNAPVPVAETAPAPEPEAAQ